MARKIGILSVGLLVMAGLVVWLQPREPQSPAPNPSAPVSPNLTASRENPVGSQQNTIGLAQKLQQSLTMLQKGPDVGKVRHGLAELSQELGAAGTNAASAAIRRFLDSGSDGPTGMQFKVGARGTLEGAPTLRTFLLDYLGQIDPAAAASYSKAVLSASQSPDEWALALRNIARGDGSSDARALLEQKTSELLRRDDWQHDPTVGYLEAFDVAVYLGGTNLAPVLEGLVQKKDNQAVAHAAYLALDRLVLADPSAMLAALQADPAAMQGRELTRANYFARADVRDPQQRQILETYLLDPRIGPAELGQFAGLYPNANYMVSPNLLTPAPAPDPAGLRARDAESLRVVQQWLADPRFAIVKPQLENIQSRLQEFARQAGAK